MELEVGPHRLLDGFERVLQLGDRGYAGVRGVLHVVLKYGHKSGDEGAEVQLGWKGHWCGPCWRWWAECLDIPAAQSLELPNHRRPFLESNPAERCSILLARRSNRAPRSTAVRRGTSTVRPPTWRWPWQPRRR